MHHALLPEISLLNCREDKEIPNILKDFISIMLIASKLVTAHHWKAKEFPSIKPWFIKLWEYLIMDKISDRLLTVENLIY